MHTLLTTDIGFQSTSLPKLAQFLSSYGCVTVCVPDKNWALHTPTSPIDTQPLHLRSTQLIDGCPAYICSGTPAQTVSLSLAVFAPINLIVSGINPCPTNHGSAYTAGVAALHEGLLQAVSGLTISCDVQGNDQQWPIIIDTIISKWMRQGIEPHSAMLIQLPANADNKQLRYQRQSLNSFYAKQGEPVSAPLATTLYLNPLTAVALNTIHNGSFSLS